MLHHRGHLLLVHIDPYSQEEEMRRAGDRRRPQRQLPPPLLKRSYLPSSSPDAATSLPPQSPSPLRRQRVGEAWIEDVGRNAFSFTPSVDGRYILLGTKADHNHAEISPKGTPTIIRDSLDYI
ncbi:unnamed protein product [Linum trigynum]|uniref:Uncharacterized protein n=1 Tax=Linum trigynum TaxID=586398 RepID=A0AAV2FN37_9ROSI